MVGTLTPISCKRKVEKHVDESFSYAFLYSMPNVVIQEDQSQVMSTN